MTCATLLLLLHDAGALRAPPPPPPRPPCSPTIGIGASDDAHGALRLLSACDASTLLDGWHNSERPEQRSALLQAMRAAAHAPRDADFFLGYRPPGSNISVEDAQHTFVFHARMYAFAADGGWCASLRVVRGARSPGARCNLSSRSFPRALNHALRHTRITANYDDILRLQQFRLAWTLPDVDPTVAPG